jgi:hypothetical protein
MDDDNSDHSFEELYKAMGPTKTVLGGWATGDTCASSKNEYDFDIDTAYATTHTAYDMSTAKLAKNGTVQMKSTERASTVPQPHATIAAGPNALEAAEALLSKYTGKANAVARSAFKRYGAQSWTRVD